MVSAVTDYIPQGQHSLEYHMMCEVAHLPNNNKIINYQWNINVPLLNFLKKKLVTILTRTC